MRSSLRNNGRIDNDATQETSVIVIHAKFGAYEMSYAKGEEIYGESESADYIYEVIHGAVRSYKSCPMAVRSARSHLPHDISAPDRICKTDSNCKGYVRRLPVNLRISNGDAIK